MDSCSRALNVSFRVCLRPLRWRTFVTIFNWSIPPYWHFLIHTPHRFLWTYSVSPSSDFGPVVRSARRMEKPLSAYVDSSRRLRHRKCARAPNEKERGPGRLQCFMQPTRSLPSSFRQLRIGTEPSRHPTLIFKDKLT